MMTAPISGPANNMGHMHRPVNNASDEAGVKSAQSVGHMAKAAIQEMGGAIELPNNIQGKIASLTARGLSLDQLFSIQKPDKPPVSGVRDNPGYPDSVAASYENTSAESDLPVTYTVETNVVPGEEVYSAPLTLLNNTD
ncbi:MAG: hypothetical protein GY742_15650 [Hyphomicrobiales bacterium]|nr:hypothetical protein [Hyphomicrobiales bacterium]